MPATRRWVRSWKTLLAVLPAVKMPETPSRSLHGRQRCVPDAGSVRLRNLLVTASNHEQDGAAMDADPACQDTDRFTTASVAVRLNRAVCRSQIRYAPLGPRTRRCNLLSTPGHDTRKRITLHRTDLIQDWQARIDVYPSVEP